MSIQVLRSGSGAPRSFLIPFSVHMFVHCTNCSVAFAFNNNWLADFILPSKYLSKKCAFEMLWISPISSYCTIWFTAGESLNAWSWNAWELLGQWLDELQESCNIMKLIEEWPFGMTDGCYMRRGLNWELVLEQQSFTTTTWTGFQRRLNIYYM